MYPNTHDVVALGERPSLQHYTKRAEDLVAAYGTGAQTVAAWAAGWPNYADQIARFAGETLKDLKDRGAALGLAQLVVARIHGFESWPAFAAHLDGLADAASPVARFEAAADAIVSGDAAALATLLREHPELIHARSTRGHRATLLHYTAANGVENYRQTTPANIVELTNMLLDAGADVDAPADMYGGGCTTLGLAATSVWPELAGVQNALMQALIDRRAALDEPQAMGRSRSVVAACLANGRVAAAEYLAAHGARLDLDGAAGLGRIDVVAGFFNPDGTLKPPATVDQLRAGMTWACEHGHLEVVQFLLDRGVLAVAPPHPGAETFLHAAALGGRAAVVRLLLSHHVPVDIIESTHNGTPLHWARYGRGNAPAGARGQYDDVIALLTRCEP